MECITIEITAAEGDPYDRSVGFLIKSDRTLHAARSVRIRPDVRLGQILLELDRVVLAWGQPQLKDYEHIHDTLDRLALAVGYPEDAGPF